jgi:hypothetical protein
MNSRKLAALAGFLALGLSPSFVDWQQSPGKRWQIVAYYAGAVALLYYGVVKD